MRGIPHRRATHIRGQTLHLYAGLAQLLELFRLNRGYQDGLPRKLLIEAFDTVADDDLVRRYRRRMASLLN